MTSNIVAQRYAKALFNIGIAAGENELESCSSSLVDLVDVLKDSPMLNGFLQKPIFSSEEKQKVLTKVAAKLKTNKTVLDFCLLMVEKNRMDSFHQVAIEFQKLVDDTKKIVRGNLVTAIELDGGKKSTVLSDLQEKTGKTLELEFKVDPKILGGVVLQVGDQIMDASLRAQLSILKETIQRGE